MPLVEFIGPNGERIERLTHHAAGVRQISVDGQTYRRAPVQAFAVARGLRPPTQRQEVLRGYHYLENKHGSRWRSKYTKNQIARAWATD